MIAHIPIQEAFAPEWLLYCDIEIAFTFRTNFKSLKPMKSIQRILLATDSRLTEQPMLEQIVEIAQRTGAALKVVDVIPDVSWPLRLAVKDVDMMQSALRSERQRAIDTLVTPIRAAGVEVATDVLCGKTSVEIIREVLRGEHDMVVSIAKGAASKASGYFGATAERLLRKCPCPLWLYAPGTAPKFEHVLACVDSSSQFQEDVDLSARVFDLAASVASYHDCRLSMLHAWSVYGEQLLKGRMDPEELARITDKLEAHATSKLNDFVLARGEAASGVSVHSRRGETAEVVADFVSDNGVDLLVMGTIARSGIAGMLIGNTAERILRKIRCSVLAVKPSGFVTPITL